MSDIDSYCIEDYEAGKKEAENKSKFSEGLAAHAILGRVEITNICIELQKTNPDDDSIYVEHRGEIKEVSKRLVKMCMVD